MFVTPPLSMTTEYRSMICICYCTAFTSGRLVFSCLLPARCREANTYQVSRIANRVRTPHVLLWLFSSFNQQQLILIGVRRFIGRCTLQYVFAFFMCQGTAVEKTDNVCR